MNKQEFNGVAMKWTTLIALIGGIAGITLAFAMVKADTIDNCKRIDRVEAENKAVHTKLDRVDRRVLVLMQKAGVPDSEIPD